MISSDICRQTLSLEREAIKQGTRFQGLIATDTRPHCGRLVYHRFQGTAPRLGSPFWLAEITIALLHNGARGLERLRKIAKFCSFVCIFDLRGREGYKIGRQCARVYRGVYRQNFRKNRARNKGSGVGIMRLRFLISRFSLHDFDLRPQFSPCYTNS